MFSGRGRAGVGIYWKGGGMNHPNDKRKLRALRKNARDYCVLMSAADPLWRDKIARVNKAATLDEIRSVVDSGTGDFQRFLLRYGQI